MYQYSLKSSLYGAPMVRQILIALVAIYIVFALSVRTGVGYSWLYFLELSPELVLTKGYLWQLVTYALLHDPYSPFHLLMNGLIFYFIGPDFERRWGYKYFLIFVLSTVLGGSAFVCLAYALGLSSQPVVGFSAVCLGLIIAWGITYQTRSIYLFGVVPIEGRTLIWGTIAIEILYSLSQTNISSAAHFGGMAAAAILTLGLWRKDTLRRHFRRLSFKLGNRRW